MMSGLEIPESQPQESPMTRIQFLMECPVCYNIPRDLPIPSCPSGHIVCRPCKERLETCPTCRLPMAANSTNSLAAALIDQVQHRCKYNDQGCEVKMMLKHLLIHEKQCPERTFDCPAVGCGRLVKLKDFDRHALEGRPRHSIKRGNSTIMIDILENDVVSNFRHFGTMVCIQALNELFHVSFAYHIPTKCFVFSILLAKSQNVTSKYRANLTIKGDDSELSYNGIKVSSLENAPSIDKCIEESGNISLCLPRNLAKNISAKKEGVPAIVEFLRVAISFKKI